MTRESRIRRGCTRSGWAVGGLGIRQFLDVGAGLPAPGPTHETAQNVNRACRVVYADNDPLVLAHGRALLTARPGAEPCAWVHGDVRDPDTLLGRAGAVLDFTKPVAVLLLALLHFVADEEDPAGIVGRFAAALAPGSLIAISHLTGDFAPEEIAAGAAACNARVPVQVHPRSRDEVTAVIRLPRPETAAPAAALASTGATEEERESAELTRAAARFPDHEITREDTGAGRAYVARARDLGTSPYLVMTGSLERLCARLGTRP